MDRADARQEAVIALWQASRSHVSALGPFRPWATRVMRARLTDLLRTATREKRQAKLVELHDVHAAPEPGRQLQDLVDLLPSLTRLERSAIAAHLNGTYDCRDRSQENALYTARKKLKAA